MTLAADIKTILAANPQVTRAIRITARMYPDMDKKTFVAAWVEAGANPATAAIQFVKGRAAPEAEPKVRQPKPAKEKEDTRVPGEFSMQAEAVYEPWPRFEVHVGGYTDRKPVHELPGIGSGRRRVEAKVGNKWVRVRNLRSTVTACRVLKDVWESVKPVALTD